MAINVSLYFHYEFLCRLYSAKDFSLCYIEEAIVISFLTQCLHLRIKRAVFH